MRSVNEIESRREACDEVKKSVSENYCTNMCSMSLTLIGVVDVKLSQEI